MKPKSAGFTLIELLISLSILGIIIVALFQTIGGTTAVSDSANSSNELIREGQIAQQVLNARFKESCYVYPSGVDITLASSGYTTRNGIDTSAGMTWTINAHPIVALILPPEATDTTGKIYRFFAYYAIPRSQYVNSAASAINPGLDQLNDSTVWMLMEYYNPIDTSNATNFPPGFSCAELAANASFAYSGQAGRLLTDFVAPVVTSTDFLSVGGTAPGGGAAFVQYSLRLQRTTRAGNTVTVGGGASGTTLNGIVYPQNLGL